MTDFSTENKAEKFDELMAEYNRLIQYRGNLVSIIFINTESTVKKIIVEQGYILKEINESVRLDSLRNIQSEIARIDNIITFIGSIICGDKNLLESKINSDN